MAFEWGNNQPLSMYFTLPDSCNAKACNVTGPTA